MIYLVADLHGMIRLDWFRNKTANINFLSGDHLIILGDAGLVWDEDDTRAIDYFDKLGCEVLFLDGNHENFDMLDSYPISSRFDGKVHTISEKISHLMRGEKYIIEKRTVFAFGGGFSVKKLHDISPVRVWDREMPNEDEYQRGRINAATGSHFDIILSHEAPTSIAEQVDRFPNEYELELTDYLETIKETVRFDSWYFGHYHKDLIIGKFRAIYEDIISLGNK